MPIHVRIVSAMAAGLFVFVALVELTEDVSSAACLGGCLSLVCVCLMPRDKTRFSNERRSGYYKVKKVKKSWKRGEL